MTTPKPVVLCILDGWGHREDREANAPALANTPNFDRLWSACPHAFLTTFGPDVGLPSGQMGNSEVGHTNIGAGRVVAMDLGQIDLAIEDGSFFDNPAIAGFRRQGQSGGGTAHLMGLTSPGGVHAHQDHIVAAAKMLGDAGVPVAVHVITDGRDVPPKSARDQIAKFDRRPAEERPRSSPSSGRYYAMDRDNRWERCRRPMPPSCRRRARPPTMPTRPSPPPTTGAKTTSSSCPRCSTATTASRTATASSSSISAPTAPAKSWPPSARPDFDGFDTGKRPAYVGPAGHGRVFRPTQRLYDRRLPEARNRQHARRMGRRNRG